MSFASFNPSDFIGNFESKQSNENNPFLTPVPSQPSQNQEQNSNVNRLQIHENIVCRLDEFIAKNKIPHIIFHGPSGSGKQTLVREFIQRIYGGDRVKIKTHVMTVNCSHGKGIQFIREELKFFAKANAQTKSNVDGGKSSEFKVITLLNAHHLTVDAQSALRRCIELFSYNTRFFIVVENKDKLLNPILSRFCDIFVPEPKVMENGPTINLHQYVLSQQFKGNHSHSVMPFPPSLQINLLDKQLSDNNTFSLTSLFRHIDHLYESGVSCLDLMDHVKTNRDLWSESEYHRAVMRFYQIKPQFRCEKLLMLFMINYLYRGKK
jgi:Cdc6-like AAA superfamily ATPase